MRVLQGCSAQTAVQALPTGNLLELIDICQAQVVNPRRDLAGVVVGEVLLSILRGHRGQQECPALLVDRLVVQRPCREWHTHVGEEGAGDIASRYASSDTLQSALGPRADTVQDKQQQ
jgi:hypothetical protein